MMFQTELQEQLSLREISLTKKNVPLGSKKGEEVNLIIAGESEIGFNVVVNKNIWA